MSKQNQARPAFIRYTDDYLERRADNVGTEREISNRALEVTLGQMIAEGDERFADVSIGDNGRPQVDGDLVTDEVLAEAAERHREYLANRPVDRREAQKALASAKQDVEFNGKFADVSDAEAKLAEAQETFVELFQADGETDFRPAADAAREASQMASRANATQLLEKARSMDSTIGNAFAETIDDLAEQAESDPDSARKALADLTRKGGTLDAAGAEWKPRGHNPTPSTPRGRRRRANS